MHLQEIESYFCIKCEPLLLLLLLLLLLFNAVEFSLCDSSPNTSNK